jgi:hypothetical protein
LIVLLAVKGPLWASDNNKNCRLLVKRGLEYKSYFAPSWQLVSPDDVTVRKLLMDYALTYWGYTSCTLCFQLLNTAVGGSVTKLVPTISRRLYIVKRVLFSFSWRVRASLR